jgi:hypothetical protein
VTGDACLLPNIATIATIATIANIANIAKGSGALSPSGLFGRSR